LSKTPLERVAFLLRLLPCDDADGDDMLRSCTCYVWSRSLREMVRVTKAAAFERCKETKGLFKL
jgi:hypothetical protein